MVADDGGRGVGQAVGGKCKCTAGMHQKVSLRTSRQLDIMIRAAGLRAS